MSDAQDPVTIVGSRAWCDEKQRLAKELNLPPTPKPPSEVTDAFFGKPGSVNMLNLGGNPWRTRNWNPRRY